MGLCFFSLAVEIVGLGSRPISILNKLPYLHIINSNAQESVLNAQMFSINYANVRGRCSRLENTLT